MIKALDLYNYSLRVKMFQAELQSRQRNLDLVLNKISGNLTVPNLIKSFELNGWSVTSVTPG